MPATFMPPPTPTPDTDSWDNVSPQPRLQYLIDVLPLLPRRLEEIVARYLVFRERELEKPVIESSLRVQRVYGISIQNASRAGYSAQGFDVATNLLWYHVGGSLKALEDVLSLHARTISRDETRCYTKEPL